MDEDRVLKILAALSERTRMRIVRYLVACGEEGASAGDVGAQVEASSSRASFHLSTLENAGAVSSERRSRHIIYRARLDNLGGAISFLLNDCCGGDPDVLACCRSATKTPKRVHK